MHEDIEVGIEEQQAQPLAYIHVEESHHPLYVALRESREKEKYPPFREMKYLFMLAAFIGYHQERWIPLGTNSRNIFARTVLKEDDLSLLRALALARTGDPEVLTNEKEIQKIAEGYANGGITVIKEQVEDAPGDRIENLVNLLLNWEPYKALISSV